MIGKMKMVSILASLLAVTLITPYGWAKEDLGKCYGEDCNLLILNNGMKLYKTAVYETKEKKSDIYDGRHTCSSIALRQFGQFSATKFSFAGKYADSPGLDELVISLRTVEITSGWFSDHEVRVYQVDTMLPRNNQFEEVTLEVKVKYYWDTDSCEATK